MKKTLRRGLALSALVGAMACGGGATKAPETPKADGREPAQSAGDPLTMADDASLSPVMAPAELLVVGRWRDPAATADTVMAWSNLPFDWRRLLEAKEPELSKVVAWGAPVEVAMALDREAGGDLAEPVAVFTVGLNSLDQAVEVARGYGEDVEQTQPGVYRIGGGGDLTCALAASVGPSPARLVCGDRDRDLDQLLPYATRGLPSEQLGGGDVHVELRLEPLRREFGSELRKFKAMGLPRELRDLKLGIPRFDRALADAAHGLVDEGIALLDDADRITLDLSASESSGALDLSIGMVLRSGKSWTAQTVGELGRAAGPAPREFWQLPADAAVADFWQSPDPKRFADVRRTLGDMLEGYLASERIPRQVRDRLADILNDTWLSQGVVVYAEGTVPRPARPPASRPDRDREQAKRVIGWRVIGLPDSAVRVQKYLDRIVATYRDREVRKLMASGGMKPADIPKLVARAHRAQGLPTGTRLYELTVPGEAFSRYSVEHDKRIAGKPLPISLILVPDGARCWVGIAADRALLSRKLGVVMRGTPTQRLGSVGGLSALKRGKHVAAGFTTLAGVSGLEWVWLAMDEDESQPGVLSQTPHQGRSPILFSLEVQSAGSTTATLRTTVPKAALEDVVSLIASSGLDLR